MCVLDKKEQKDMHMLDKKEQKDMHMFCVCTCMHLITKGNKFCGASTGGMRHRIGATEFLHLVKLWRTPSTEPALLYLSLYPLPRAANPS
jgi:hypothetical protein